MGFKTKYADSGFWSDTFDRMIATGAQTAGGALAADYSGLIGVDWQGLASIVGFSMVGTVLYSVARQGGAERKAKKAAGSDTITLVRPEAPQLTADEIGRSLGEADPVPPAKAFITDEMEGRPGSIAEQQRDVDEAGLALDRAAHAGDIDPRYGDLELQIHADDREAFPEATEVWDTRSEDPEHYGQYEDVTEDSRPDDTERYDQFEDVTEDHAQRGRRGE